MSESNATNGLSLEIQKLRDTEQELKEIIHVWQDWWNTYGFEWYKNHEHPQSEKPPFLKANSPHLLS